MNPARTDPGGAPPAHAVAPDVWRIPLPIPEHPRLGHIAVHAVLAGSSVLLIDAGWDSPASLRALEDGLALAGARIDDVAGVVVTHAHPDHYGLGGTIRARSGAWIGLHADDVPLLFAADEDLDQHLRLEEAWLRACGAPALDIAEVSNASRQVLLRNRAEPPDRLLTDGNTLRWGERRLTVLHTPGHTPGHLCLADLDHGIVFTGDQLLPRITANVWAGPASRPDPLADHLRSLDRLRTIGATTALPAHGAPFTGVAARATAVHDHHVSELAQLERLVRRRPGTTWDLARAMPWSRPWRQIDPFLRRAAVGETLAHLVHLERSERVERHGAPAAVWQGPDGSLHRDSDDR